MKLTAASIKKAKPGDTIRDDVVRGLQMRVFANHKSFYFYYRPKSAVPPERRPKIGDYPTLSIQAAREIAREWAYAVALGQDPTLEIKRAAGLPTVSELCDRYLREYAEPEKKPASVAGDARLIKAIIKPKMGKVLVQDLDYAAVQSVHQSLRATKYQANRTLALLSKMLNLAELWQLRKPYSNPCRFVTKFKEQKRRRYMTGEEAPAISAQLLAYKESHPQAVLFLYLLILTGARPAEIALAKPEWVSGDRINLLDSKTGARPIWLPPVVQELIKQIPAGSTTLTGLQSPRHIWKEIRVKAGCPDLRIYDLRHTFASAALASGYTLAQIGELLGHTNTQTTSRYAHLIDSKAAEIAANTADYLEDMLGSNKA